jgi:hypothetical protein
VNRQPFGVGVFNFSVFVFSAGPLAARGEPNMRRLDLVPDCGSCDAICCVATSFEASEDFAITKAAGARCPHLTAHQCTIHGKLIARGFLGCSIYDCYGAGPKITRAFAGAHGRETQRNAAFLALRIVHELLWQLTEASKLCPPSREDVAADLAREIARLDAIAQAPTAVLLATDLTPSEESARATLRRVGEALGGRSVTLHVLPSV